MAQAGDIDPLRRLGAGPSRRRPCEDGAVAMRSRRRLLREIGCALAFKAVALTLLYFAFFGPQNRATLTPEQVADHVLPPATLSLPRDKVP
jgi:hypothetical protein